jgi:hypothetical protein
MPDSDATKAVKRILASKLAKDIRPNRNTLKLFLESGGNAAHSDMITLILQVKILVFMHFRNRVRENPELGDTFGSDDFMPIEVALFKQLIVQAAPVGLTYNSLVTHTAETWDNELTAQLHKFARNPSSATKDLIKNYQEELRIQDLNHQAEHLKFFIISGSAVCFFSLSQEDNVVLKTTIKQLNNVLHDLLKTQECFGLGAELKLNLNGLQLLLLASCELEQAAQQLLNSYENSALIKSRPSFFDRFIVSCMVFFNFNNASEASATQERLTVLHDKVVPSLRALSNTVHGVKSQALDLRAP